jgi:hypothetical protein
LKCSILSIVLTLAASQTDADLKQDIIDRCRAHLGKHGSAAVRACTEQDIAAAEALTEYPNTAERTVLRCRTQLKYLGWSRVKACVDQNLEAKAALSSYPEKYQAIIDGCQTRMGAFGWHMVKACTDRDIGSGKATD